MSQFTGHLHPLLVHLPIGILLLACFFQLLSVRAQYSYLQPVIGIVLFWGMITAIASCISGYVLSGTGDYDEDLVGKHQWLGISVAVLSLVYYLMHRYNTLIKYKWVLPVFLILLVSFTGHLGGSLTHGSDYLTAPFTNMAAADTLVAKKVIINVQEAAAYNDIIQPLLQSKCYSCHGAAKQKGKLRMDETALLMKGGKDGAIIEPGKPDESELIKRVLLEKANDHHMPPKEKPQLTEKEIALLHWWIAGGASFDKKTKELPQAEKIKPILASLQNTVIEKKEVADVPAVPVEKADEQAIKTLKDMGVVVMPVAINSNYLQVSFVAVPNAGDKELQLLMPLKKQMVWLKLNDTKITDAALPLLAQCSNLSKLELINTAVTDKGLVALAALQQLQVLSIVGTKTTAAGLLPLKNIHTLKSVYFYHTGIKNTDWSTLVKAFPVVQLDSGGYQVPLLQTDTMLVKPPKQNQ